MIFFISFKRIFGLEPSGTLSSRRRESNASAGYPSVPSAWFKCDKKIVKNVSGFFASHSNASNVGSFLFSNRRRRYGKLA